eukprot:7387440-Prymnesium_polylepis.3
MTTASKTSNCQSTVSSMYIQSVQHGEEARYKSGVMHVTRMQRTSGRVGGPPVASQSKSCSSA